MLIILEAMQFFVYLLLYNCVICNMPVYPKMGGVALGL